MVLPKFYELREDYTEMLQVDDWVKKSIATNCIRILDFKMRLISNYAKWGLLLDPKNKEQIMNFENWQEVSTKSKNHNKNQEIYEKL